VSPQRRGRASSEVDRGLEACLDGAQHRVGKSSELAGELRAVQGRDLVAEGEAALRQTAGAFREEDGGRTTPPLGLGGGAVLEKL
jgi:hypothetical protein